MKSGAYVTSGGVWTNASSREYKKDIKALSSEDAMVAFNQLEPVSFKYKNDDEQHVGFIAEDVPDLVASGDRKGLSSMDMVAVLTKVVQEQQKAIAMLSKEVKSLKAKVKNNKTAALTKQSN
ncbi:MAG: tail fiber domain-containing protein [Nitrospirae bacterium]|nr:tail fiber domain-containing protein [Nitrospirota bacterium]